MSNIIYPSLYFYLIIFRHTHFVPIMPGVLSFKFCPKQNVITIAHELTNERVHRRQRIMLIFLWVAERSGFLFLDLLIFESELTSASVFPETQNSQPKDLEVICLVKSVDQLATYS